MDLVEQMNNEYETAFTNPEKWDDRWDGTYSRVRLPREFFIRVCRALAAVEKITHELHTLALEEPEEKPGTHWGKLEVEFKYLVETLNWDEKKSVRVVIDYDPDAERVLLLRCPVNRDAKEPEHPAEE